MARTPASGRARSGCHPAVRIPGGPGCVRAGLPGRRRARVPTTIASNRVSAPASAPARAARSPRRGTARTPVGLVGRQAEPSGDDWRASAARAASSSSSTVAAERLYPGGNFVANPHDVADAGPVEAGDGHGPDGGVSRPPKPRERQVAMLDRPVPRAIGHAPRAGHGPKPGGAPPTRRRLYGEGCFRCLPSVSELVEHGLGGRGPSVGQLEADRRSERGRRSRWCAPAPAPARKRRAPRPRPRSTGRGLPPAPERPGRSGPRARSRRTAPAEPPPHASPNRTADAGTWAVTGTVRSRTCPATDSSTPAERAGRRHERWRSVESEIR